MTVVPELPPEIANRIKAIDAELGLTLPPPVFLEMGGEFVSYSSAEGWLKVRFPVQERFQNPLGFMQGGMIAAAVDNTIGPLSFLVAPPSVTRTLTLEYRRPVRPSEPAIVVTARLLDRDGEHLTFAADVRDGRDRLLARATAEHTIVKGRPPATG